MNAEDVLLSLAAVVAGYLLGSVPFAYLAARAAGVNILEVGTRNPGAANLFRVVSRRLGAAGFLADTLKGAGAVIAARAIGMPEELAPIAGAAAVAGHFAPIFLGFRGGAGLAAAMGAALAVAPIQGGIGVAVGVPVVLLTRSSGHAAAAGFLAMALIGYAVRSEWAATSSAVGLAGVVFGRYLVIALLKRRGTAIPGAAPAAPE